MADLKTKYVGCGLYISEWRSHDGPEGNLRREDFDLMYGPSMRYATAQNPERFVGTFATYPEIEGNGG